MFDIIKEFEKELDTNSKVEKEIQIELFELYKSVLEELKTSLKSKKKEDLDKRVSILSLATKFLKDNNFVITPKQKDNKEEYIEELKAIEENFEDMPDFNSIENK